MMQVIKFEAHLIELDDLCFVQDHIMAHEPCVAFYKITYPQGNTAYFTAVASEGKVHSVTTGAMLHEMIPAGKLT